jgi:glycosyltransferase involved in cell wall biosynthesis
MITYGITVSNECFEFKRLIDSLTPYLIEGEEIIILADESKVTEEIKTFCKSRDLTINYHKFNNNFSEFKNKLIPLTSTRFLFQIDADEQIPPSLLFAVRDILLEDNYDCIWIPRINIVNGYTNQDAIDFNWNVNDRKWIQFPDYQVRVFKADGTIKWHKGVHEEVAGYSNKTIINYKPIELFSILHVKDISKQRQQNNLYKQIENNE